MELKFPANYKSKLSIVETERAILLIKQTFEKKLAQALNLTRVSAPLFVRPETGLNDNLNGIERPVEFEISDIGVTAQIVQSLAKWKRMALALYGFPVDEGLYTDMNAIRRDEKLDPLHSIYVDQWDWEMVISRESRTLDKLKSVVQTIVDAIASTLETVELRFPQLTTHITRNVHFITAQELEDCMPNLSPHDREEAIVRQYKTVCIMQIGDKLRSGIKHDGRAPDYDDWQLNGDIFFFNSLLDRSFELSSMGIRVDRFALLEQLQKCGCEDRKTLPFHRMLLENKLPLTIGGGIGQSRMCMLFLQKAHIGEVQCSVWPEDVINSCEAHGAYLL